MKAQWLRLVEACRRGRRSQNVLYRLGVTGQIRTRCGPDGRLEFHAEDVDRLPREREEPRRAFA
jgi:predicted site-specific integrase-resolvase